MITSATSFYVTGGTLSPDAPSYVERQADRDLHEGLSRGEFCYVLTSRQMGKSSLMAHTAARLREEGVGVAVLDLTAVGQHLTVEQWYDGLLRHMGRYLDLEDELEEFWFDHARLSPLQRWMAALQQIVLARCPGRIVLFLDEIDAVQSLPFSSDEFFAAIRHCYNRRSEDPEFSRLTFCLLGVATPSGLIQDTRTTPFNIGRRIELMDFTEAEAAPLAAGLGVRCSVFGVRAEPGLPNTEHRTPNTEHLLQRVLYWTGGHPYLTQRLCQAVAAAKADPPTSEIQDPKSEVDRLCDALFLAHRARERDDNLLFVRDRLLRSEADPAGLLSLYARVRSPRQKVADDERNPLVSLLRLSGVVRERRAFLQVRNRIYARVFDPAWVAANMPDAELRRLRAVAREEARKRRWAEEQRRVAEERELTARRYLYVASVNVAQQAWEAGNGGWAQEMLEAQRPRSGQEDLRGFEWRYLWRLCRSEDQVTFRGHEGQLWSVAWSPDGRILATGSVDKTVKLWDIVSHRELAVLQGHRQVVTAVAFSLDGAMLASASGDGTARLWKVDSHQEMAVIEGHREGLLCVAFSPDGRTLATGSGDSTAKLWDIAAWETAGVPKEWSWSPITLTGHGSEVRGVAFSPDGQLLATGSFDHTVKLWSVATGRELATLGAHGGIVRCVSFSPDGRTLAAGSVAENWPNSPGEAKLWDIASRQELATLRGHKALVRSVAFSPDGRILATCSLDQTTKLWDLASGEELATLRGHTDWVTSVAFSPDGRTLATGGKDETARLWDATTRREPDTLQCREVWVPERASGPVLSCTALSADGRTVAAGGNDNRIKLWSLATLRELATFDGHQGWIESLAFSPDGKCLASGSSDQTVRLWDLCGMRELAILTGHRGEVGPVVFSPDGEMLATGGADQTVKLWEVATQRERATLTGHQAWITAAAFSADGRMIATASLDATVKLWSAATGHELASLRGHRAQVNSVAFSPDGQMVATGSNDNTIKLWDAAAGRETGVLKGHTGWVDSVAFSPDGKTLATGGFDNTVKLWNLVTRWEIATLKAHAARVISAAFTADGQTLVTASVDGAVRLWRAAPFTETDARRRKGIASSASAAQDGNDRADQQIIRAAS